MTTTVFFTRSMCADARLNDDDVSCRIPMQLAVRNVRSLHCIVCCMLAP